MTKMAISPQANQEPKPPRMRIRQLLPDLHLGPYPPGPLNSLTDIPGLKVSTQEVHTRNNSTINTGVTCIVPRADWIHSASHVGLHVSNGSGELSGAHFISETGLLLSPIVLTGTFGVGAAHQGVLEYAIRVLGGEVGGDWLFLPVVGETFDGYLHDVASFAVTPERVVQGLLGAKAGERVQEGNSGGGVGMVCHFFKGGTGSSSRVVEVGGDGAKETFTIAALVQANYGRMVDLRIGGVPVGRVLMEEEMRDEESKARLEEVQEEKKKKDGSIIVVIATDAPLHPLQLQRIARRAGVGLARVGGFGNNLSGDIFLAFSTGNEIPVNHGKSEGAARIGIDVLDDAVIDGLFEATADVTEEAIYIALCMADTMVGNQGHKVEALPLDRVREIMARFQES